MCVDIKPKYINDRIPMTQNHGSPIRNDLLIVTARLYFGLITCFLYKRLKILPDLYVKICPQNIAFVFNFITSNILQLSCSCPKGVSDIVISTLCAL